MLRANRLKGDERTQAIKTVDHILVFSPADFNLDLLRFYRSKLHMPSYNCISTNSQLTPTILN